MAFDGITIANIVTELNQTITGGKINKIAQPENDELLFTCKGSNGQFRLGINADIGLPRLIRHFLLKPVDRIAALFMADGRQKDNPQHKQSCRRQNHQPRTQAKLLFFIGLLRLIFLLGLRLGLSLFLGHEFQPHQFRKPRQGLIIRFGSPRLP